MIRPARPGDAEAQRTVERDAGVAFAEIGMPEIAEDEPMSPQALAAYANSGRSWVATGEGDRVVGYVVVDLIDGCAHIEQITVEPDHQGQGLGRALIDQVDRWAAAAGIEAITLTTFADVPWNRPLYEHLGFRVLREEEVTPGLRGLLAAEARLSRQPRVSMRRSVSKRHIASNASPLRPE